MKYPFTCLIVDDEPSAQQILEQYIGDIPSLEAVHISDDALDAMEYLKEHSVDILFLDVNMPKLSGISFLKSLPDPPAVILTTAYDDYALEGYELNVIDYLLKPFSFERFLKAVNKTEQRIGTGPDGGNCVLSVKADGKVFRVEAEHIRYIESMGDYVSIHLEGRKLISYDTLKNLEDLLPAGEFIRIHKSYIVALAKVDYLEGNRVKIGESTIPVGNTYKNEIKQYFK